MTPAQQKFVRETSIALLAGVKDMHPKPGHIVLAKYETQLDYETLRPEDQPARVEDHSEMIEHIATAIATHCHMQGIRVLTPIVHASTYLRWLAANHLTNTAANRAAFISTAS
jgi:hypothetical protein